VVLAGNFFFYFSVSTVRWRQGRVHCLLCYTVGALRLPVSMRCKVFVYVGVLECFVMAVGLVTLKVHGVARVWLSMFSFCCWRRSAWC
jgi:hypothetical protein